MTIALLATNDGLSGQLQVAGTTVMSFGADASGQLTGFRNYLYNGGAQLALKGSTAVTVNSIIYGGADRTAIDVNCTTGSGTIQQYSGVATTTGYAQGVNATGTVSGTGWLWFLQRIEAINSKSLNSKTVTLSCIVYQNTGSSQPILLRIEKPTTGLDDYSGGMTFLAISPMVNIPSGVPTKVSFTTTLGSSDATNGLAVSAYFTFTVGFTSKDFWIGDFQLEQGSIATPFELRSQMIEQYLCRRYLQQISYNWTMWTLSGLGFNLNEYLPVQMRNTPVIVTNSITTNTNITNSGLTLNKEFLSQPGYATAQGQVIYKGLVLLSAEL